MKWIRVASRVAADAKVRQIARDVGADPYKVVGHLVTLWGVMTDQAKDGDLSGVHDDDVEAWAEWTGKRGKFARSVRAHLCDAAGVVSAWERYQGAAIRENEADRRRKSPGTPPEIPRNSGGTPGGKNRNTDGTPAATSTRGTTKDLTAGGGRAGASAGGRDHGGDPDVEPSPDIAAVHAHLPDEYLADLHDLLMRLERASRPAWVRDLRQLLAPSDADRTAGRTPGPGTVVGQAIREFNANAKAGAGLRVFAGYVQRVANPLPPRANGAHPTHSHRANPRDAAGAATFANALAAVDLLTGDPGDAS
jgi:hypothetical protein